MKNIHSINDFKKLYEEGDKFSADVSFSDSLIGRGFNGIFKLLRKSANKGRLIFFKRQLENEYIKAILATVSDEDINKMFNSKEEVAKKEEQLADKGGMLLELGPHIAEMKLPDEKVAIALEPEKNANALGEDGKATLPESEKKPLVFTRYEEWSKIIKNIEKPSEDDIKIIKKINEDLTKINTELKTTLAWYAQNPNTENEKSKFYDRLQKESKVFIKEQEYVSKLISDCEIIINKYKVETDFSDEEYTQLIAKVEDDLVTSNTNVDTTQTQQKNSQPQPKVQDTVIATLPSDKLSKIAGIELNPEFEIPKIEIRKKDDIFQQINSIYQRLKKALPKEKHKKLKNLFYKYSLEKGTHPDKGGTTDVNILKDFYDELKMIESILHTFENTNYNNFLIDQKLDDAMAILEKSNKNSNKLNTKLSAVTGNAKFGDIDLNQLDDKNLKELFAKNPTLIEEATKKVNIEAIKDIEYSARLIYDPSISISNTLLKNFKNNEADAKQYELFWKKMVAKVKREFNGLLNLDEVDPIKLVNDEERERGGTPGKKDKNGNDKIPNAALDTKLDETKATSAELKALGAGSRKPPIKNDGGYPAALLQTAITEGKYIGTYYILCDVFSKNNAATFRINKIFDGKKITEAGEDKILKMSKFDEFVVKDLEVLNYFKSTGQNVYYERIKGKGAGTINTISESPTNAIKNTFKMLEFVNDKLQSLSNSIKIPVTKFLEVVDGKVRSKLNYNEHQTEEEMDKIK